MILVFLPITGHHMGMISDLPVAVVGVTIIVAVGVMAGMRMTL